MVMWYSVGGMIADQGKTVVMVVVMLIVVC